MKLLKVSGFNLVYMMEKFEEEFEAVVSETKADGRYHKWLRRKLAVLDSLGQRAVGDRDFEPLQGTDPKLYAIRYPKSPKNPRVIYVYIEDNRICLLHTFKEGSKKSGSDYDAAINIATNRIKYL